MYTINKKDMKKFMDIMFPVGYQGSHMYDIFIDLISVYDDNVDYTLSALYIPFTVTIPARMALEPTKTRYSLNEIAVFQNGKALLGTKVVKYEDYLIVLYYVSYALKFSDNVKVCTDVSGKICNDFPLFQLDSKGWDKWYLDYYGENYKDWRYRWHSDGKNSIPHHFTLTNIEHEESDKVYDKYIEVKSSGDLKC